MRREPERLEHRRRNLGRLDRFVDTYAIHTGTPEDDRNVPILRRVAAVFGDLLDLGRVRVHGADRRDTDDVRHAIVARRHADELRRGGARVDLPEPRVRHGAALGAPADLRDRKSTRLNSSHEWISYAVFCLKKKNKERNNVIPQYKPTGSYLL